MKESLKNRSGLLAVLTACAIPIHLWALILIVGAIPQWLLRLNQVQMIGAVGYSLVLALLETVIVFIFVMALLLILPKRLVEPAAVPLALAFVVLTLGLMVFVLLTPFGNQPRLLLGFAAYLVLVVVAYIIIKRWPRLARMITSLIDRLVPLALLYVVLDLAGLILVIVRNVTA